MKYERCECCGTVNLMDVTEWYCPECFQGLESKIKNLEEEVYRLEEEIKKYKLMQIIPPPII